jgi:hypothetical protein
VSSPSDNENNFSERLEQPTTFSALARKFTFWEEGMCQRREGKGIVEPLQLP